jgi:hypothetical protein
MRQMKRDRGVLETAFLALEAIEKVADPNPCREPLRETLCLGWVE